MVGRVGASCFKEGQVSGHPSVLIGGYAARPGWGWNSGHRSCVGSVWGDGVVVASRIFGDWGVRPNEHDAAVGAVLSLCWRRHSLRKAVEQTLLIWMFQDKFEAIVTPRCLEKFTCCSDEDPYIWLHDIGLLFRHICGGEFPAFHTIHVYCRGQCWNHCTI